MHVAPLSWTTITRSHLPWQHTHTHIYMCMAPLALELPCVWHPIPSVVISALEIVKLLSFWIMKWLCGIATPHSLVTSGFGIVTRQVRDQTCEVWGHATHSWPVVLESWRLGRVTGASASVTTRRSVVTSVFAIMTSLPRDQWLGNCDNMTLSRDQWLWSSSYPSVTHQSLVPDRWRWELWLHLMSWPVKLRNATPRRDLWHSETVTSAPLYPPRCAWPVFKGLVTGGRVCDRKLRLDE